MLLLFGTFALINALCWGGVKSRWLGVCAIVMWGPGDAAAALVGMRYGKHKVALPFADRKKSWEGTLAMCAVSFLIGLACLTIGGIFPFHKALFSALLVSPLAAYTELITKNGNDTLSVPTVNALALCALHLL